MPKSPDQIPENIDFAAEELTAADPELREAMLEEIAKSLTRNMLRENPRFGVREISGRVTRFICAVREKIKSLDGFQEGET
jgi:hypothetical protein